MNMSVKKRRGTTLESPLKNPKYLTRNHAMNSPIKVGASDMIHPQEMYGTLNALDRAD